MLLLCVFGMNAQKNQYTIERIGWVNPWLSGGNMAALAFNGGFLCDTVSSFGSASLSLAGATGDCRGIYDPSQSLEGRLGVESYLRQKNVWLYGSFDYHYDYGTKSRWRGLVDPYETPFMMADSIPGSISRERYVMRAGVAVPFGKWSVGMDVAYEASLMAKHKDLRNKNTYMDFRIAPGVMYSGSRFTLGLDAGYLRNTEKIEYMQVEESRECYLFDLYGMWLYSGSGFSSAENRRMKEKSGLFGDFQTGITLGNVRLVNNFGVLYTSIVQTETGYNNLRHGDTRQLTYRDNLDIYGGMRHKVSLSIETSRMLGWRFLQRQELDPASKVRMWVTYGDPVNCYVRDICRESLAYTYRAARSAWDIPWEVTAGISEMTFGHSYTEYPQVFSQRVSAFEPYLTFTKNFGGDADTFGVTPRLSWRHVYDSCENDISYLEGTPGTEGDRPWQLTGPLHTEFEHLSSDMFNAGLSLLWHHTLKSTSALSVGVSYNLTVPGADLGRRHCAGLTLGFTF